jgi:hypothetical protein
MLYSEAGLRKLTTVSYLVIELLCENEDKRELVLNFRELPIIHKTDKCWKIKEVED